MDSREACISAETIRVRLVAALGAGALVAVLLGAAVAGRFGPSPRDDVPPVDIASGSDEPALLRKVELDDDATPSDDDGRGDGGEPAASPSEDATVSPPPASGDDVAAGAAGGSGGDDSGDGSADT